MTLPPLAKGLVLLILVSPPLVGAADALPVLASVPDYVIKISHVRTSGDLDVVGPGPGWLCASSRGEEPTTGRNVVTVTCERASGASGCRDPSVVAYGYVTTGTSGCQGASASCHTAIMEPQLSTCRSLAYGAGAAPWTCRLAYTLDGGNAAAVCGVSA